MLSLFIANERAAADLGGAVGVAVDDPSPISDLRPENPMLHRLPALDWMRGILMVLMATDHASGAFN